MTDAAYRAGVARSWWQNVEAGSPKNEPKPDKLAAAVRAVGGDLRRIFNAAGFDPEPFDRPMPLDDRDARRQIAEALESLTERFDRLERRLDENADRQDEAERQLDGLAQIVARLEPQPARPTPPPERQPAKPSRSA